MNNARLEVSIWKVLPYPLFKSGNSMKPFFVPSCSLMNTSLSATMMDSRVCFTTSLMRSGRISRNSILASWEFGVYAIVSQEVTPISRLTQNIVHYQEVLLHFTAFHKISYVTVMRKLRASILPNYSS